MQEKKITVSKFVLLLIFNLLIVEHMCRFRDFLVTTKVNKAIKIVCPDFHLDISLTSDWRIVTVLVVK